jgi:hypothetical protein
MKNQDGDDKRDAVTHLLQYLGWNLIIAVDFLPPPLLSVTYKNGLSVSLSFIIFFLNDLG